MEPTIKDGETVWWCPSESNGKPYVIDLEGRNGRGVCDCPDYQFRSSHEGFLDCKHIRKVFRAFARHKLREVMIARGTLNQRTDGP